MEVSIITSPLELHLHGFGAVAANKDYVGRAFELSRKTWELVKSHGIKNKGKNIWVYEDDHHVFAGLELENNDDPNRFGLQEKKIVIEKYAYCKHIGPYQLIKQAGQNMKAELTRDGFTVIAPYIEIYGHWTGDEAKSETELIMGLQ